MTTTRGETYVRLVEESRAAGTCRGCAAEIEWFETLTGRKMPMNFGAVAQRTEPDPATRKTIGYFSAADTHWGSCPERERFRGRR
jgi:hypothetical protein